MTTTLKTPPKAATAQPYAMIFEQDVPIEVSDGNVLRANVFRPDAPGRFPVVMAQGVYGKDVHFEDAFKMQWDQLISVYPELCSNGSTGRYLRWETADPERWVPDGFVIIHVDSRGAGKSPGYLDPRSPREIVDYYDAIEWASAQPWSNGKVGLLGISYYAVTQWRVATLRPPHLAAICPWEGYVDYYRDSTHHGGILSSGFANYWWPKQCLAVQHGNGNTPHRDRLTGGLMNGEPLSEAKLVANRTDYPADIVRHSLDSTWWRERTPVLERINVPVLSAGNWGGPGMHLRGNIEGFLGAGSREKMAVAACRKTLGELLSSRIRRDAEAVLQLFPARRAQWLGSGAARQAGSARSKRRPHASRPGFSIAANPTDKLLSRCEIGRA